MNGPCRKLAAWQHWAEGKRRAARAYATRDEDPFDSDWLSAHQELESRKRGLDAPSCAATCARKLRERVFKRVLGQAGDDIAGYISDDFGLMFDALAMDDLEASWVFGLYECYASARFRRDRFMPGADPC